jgi:Ca2+-transporting ATPase
VFQTVHSGVKGRIRIKVHGLYRSESLKKHLEHRLNGLSGIGHASGSILTGNLLILFNSDQTPDKLITIIKKIVAEYANQSLSDDIALPAVNPTVKANIPADRRQANHSWHVMDSGSVLAFLDTGSLGLPSESARERLTQYGPNLLPESLPRSRVSIFIDQFKSLPVALLAAAAGLSVITGGIADAVVIIGVVGINATIGYVTESQTEATIHSLKKLVNPSATVIRDGFPKEIPAEEVVIGDLLVLRPGSYIAADARLLESRYLYVDESALTGENMPVLKTSELLLTQNIPLADRINLVYMGTLVTGGEGFAIVVATGGMTEMGQIQVLAGEAVSPETPMERQLSRMGNQLVLISGAVCAGVFVIGLLRGYGLLEMLKIAISLAVAAVPEGLPTVATTTLALGIRNMRRHHVLIRHLHAVETLGAVQTICLDKTGTITLNKMSVVVVNAGMRSIKVTEGKFTAWEEQINPFTCDELLRLLHISVLCSETEVSLQRGEHILQGSPTENALVYLAISTGVDVLKIRKDYPLVKVTHRSENRNYMTTLHESRSYGKLLAVKGSPTEVLAMCKWYIKDGQQIPLSDNDRSTIQVENERMAGDSLRVLGLAYAQSDHTEEKSHIRDGLIWVGLMGMADPIRKGVKDLIGTFHQAGIETVMITGDQSPTAYAIGKELSLSGNESLEILDSTHLTKVEPDVMEALSKRVHVFSRVSPAHKLQIVQALQKAGKVVAMTGDGINDGPALKAADIGIAMGHTGTDVAREVADVILENDNLETMIVAVSHGRTIYNNIRKSVHFLLATNLSEILVMVTSLTAGMGEPLNSMQLLWINLVSDIFPGLALALEPPEPDVLNQPPRNPKDPILQPADFKKIGYQATVLSAGAMGAYGYGILRYGVGPRAGTMAFMSLVLGQLLHAVNCRSERHSIYDSVIGQASLPSNQYLNMALGGTFALQVAALAIPGLRSLLGITSIGLVDGIVVGGSALIPLLVNEATKPSIQPLSNNRLLTQQG